MMETYDENYIIDKLTLIHEGQHDIRLTTEGFFTYSDEQSRFFISDGAPTDSRLVLSPEETRHAICSALMNSFQKEIKQKQNVLHEKIVQSRKVGSEHLHGAEKNFLQEMTNVSELFRKNITLLMMINSPAEGPSLLNGETLTKVLHHYQAVMKAVTRRSQWACRKVEASSAHPA